MNQEMTLMIQTMLSNGMSVSQIAKCVSKSEEEIMKWISQPLFMAAFFLATLSGKRRFENYNMNIQNIDNNLVDKNCIRGERKWKKFKMFL